MKSEDSLPYLQKLSAAPCPESLESSPYIQTLFL
jgi:hypothetical protein